MCLSFAGFERRVPGQSPDPARLRQPRSPYNRLSFTSPFFRCILRKRAQQTVSLGLRTDSPPFFCSQITTELRPILTGSRRPFAPRQPDLLCGTQHLSRLRAQHVKRRGCSERTASSKEPVRRGEQGTGRGRIRGAERWMNAPQCLGRVRQSPS